MDWRDSKGRAVHARVVKVERFRTVEVTTVRYFDSGLRREVYGTWSRTVFA